MALELWLFLIIGPLFAGAFSRFLVRGQSRGWLVTALLGAFALVMIILSQTVNTHGSEELALRTWQVVNLALGSLACGGILWLGRKRNNNEDRAEKDI